MFGKKLLLFLMCAVLAFTLAGCGNGNVESTVSEVVSDIGDGVSNVVSRVESDVESMFGGGMDDDENSRDDDAMRDESSPLYDEESGLSSGLTSDGARTMDRDNTSRAANDRE